ncbi:hypothetical protein RhiirA1_479962 [Rhizophagus irregularis]|uniref:Uncharacterized protein n=1 Tax=Rhizophagus irregularis TaxID=588596 RepID=A0A2I1FPK3_9GLOM|nr:hypothetical protein RhiirA1_479962 [Rhizophagus irregularis]PKY36330.1 hypothetical protein RhiirB3_458682 [Rhizophagus irregularis]GET51773.1 hypothetical protein RIR_e66739_A0A2I1FPK3_9GLOM [Rhizophagus irregularis DAOM 181602=DAOM 197198]
MSIMYFWNNFSGSKESCIITFGLTYAFGRFIYAHELNHLILKKTLMYFIFSIDKINS